jgi:hypothetical protein
VYTSEYFDLRTFVHQLPPGRVPAVQGVNRQFVSQKITVGIPEEVGKMGLGSVVSVGD